MQKLIPLFCVNWIIFFFQFESFGIGPVTVVRFLIFPFLLLYVFSVRRMNIYKSFSFLFYRFKISIRTIWIKTFVCPHHSHQILRIGKIYDIVRITW